VNLNKNLADELNQPTSLPAAHSNKKIQKTVKPKTQTTQWVGLLKKPGF